MWKNTVGTCAVLILASCAGVPGQPADRRSEVVAEVDDQPITLQELDASWNQIEPAEYVRLEQELYEGRRNALDQLIAGLLIERAAREGGVSVDEYVKVQIQQRLQPVTRGDIEAFYDENGDQVGGRSLADVEADIRSHLEQRAPTAARDALVADLRKAGPTVKVTLEAPRYSVDVVAHDPIRGAPSAPVTIVEFSDYQCPFARKLRRRSAGCSPRTATECGLSGKTSR